MEKQAAFNSALNKDIVLVIVLRYCKIPIVMYYRRKHENYMMHLVGFSDLKAY